MQNLYQYFDMYGNAKFISIPERFFLVDDISIKVYIGDSPSYMSCDIWNH